MKVENDENDKASIPASTSEDIKAIADEAGIGIVDAGEAGDSKDEEKKEEDKKKYANWPFRDIKEPHANDVLYGRGGMCPCFVRDVLDR
jgi:hypothetical protein